VEEIFHGSINPNEPSIRHTFGDVFCGGAAPLAAAEESVHPALAQRQLVARVLMIGGLFSGAAVEALHYKPDELIVVEPDAAAVRTAREVGLLPETPALKVIVDDPGRYLRSGKDTFDAVLILVGDPETVYANRLITEELFAAVRHRLSPQGVLSLSLPPGENAITHAQRLVLAPVWRSAMQHFQYGIALPLGRNVFIFADQQLDTDIATRISAGGLPTQFINEGYLQGMLTADRLAQLQNAVTPQQSRILTSSREQC
jgi:spermidine synthase